jgi:NAD(P)-dependent dehydrogenase (short-subunit alcohol dehydrogenase family)
MRVDIDGKVAVVTGGVRNIGRATALALAGSGATVAVTYATDSASAAETVDAVSALGGKCVAYQVDVADVAALRATFAQIRAELGDVSILVNNAAVRPRHKIADMQPEDFDAAIAVNLRAPMFTAQAVLPGMREQGWGRIVNLSGGTAFFGGVERAHVVASKLGVVGLSRALALETAAWGVTVNSVVPGAVDTVRDAKAGSVTHHLDRIPVGRLGRPEEIAATVLFLCSPEAGYITGQEIKVTGGHSPLSRQPWAEY